MPEAVIVGRSGSGCSLGHPVAATGARMLVTLVHELRRRGGGIGVAAMCAGGGMGSATVIEVDGAASAATSGNSTVVHYFQDDHRRAHRRGAQRVHPGGRTVVEPGRELPPRRSARRARRDHTVPHHRPDGAARARASRRRSPLWSARTAAREMRVAVLAVDPSSPYSGGALLGDRIRMAAHINDPDVLIRSVATRGHLGGLAAAVPAATRLLAALSYDLIVAGDGRRRPVRDRDRRHRRPDHRRPQSRCGRRGSGRQGGPARGRRHRRGEQGRP